MTEENIIFITGVGRSGTTILQSMMHAHSKINFSVETHFFKRYIIPFLLKGNRATRYALHNDHFLQRLPAHKFDQLTSKNLEQKQDFIETFISIMSSSDRETVFIGDKDTEYVRYFPHLANVFPKAYIIHIIRDPRDVMASRLKTEWGSKRSIEFHIAEYQYYIKKMRKDDRKLFDGRYIEIKYEDLITQPQVELEKVMTIIGLEFEDGMLNFQKAGTELVSKDEYKWKQNISKPLDSANSGRWKNTLPVADAALLQWGMNDFFEEMGYEKINVSASLGRKLKIEALKNLFRAKTFRERLY